MENEQKQDSSGVETTVSNPSSEKASHQRYRFMLLPTLLILFGLFVFGAAIIGSGHRRIVVSREKNARFELPRPAMIGRKGDQFTTRGRTLGAVTTISGDTITIKQHDQDVKLTISSDTSIYKNGAVAKQSDIKVGDVLIVGGRPGSDGAILARVIEIN